MIFLKSEDSPTDSPDVVSEEEAMTESQITLNSFWPSITDEVKRIKQVDGRNQVLPLARIKKIMKLDDDVKMISAEAPLLFAKACEIFIHELTLRAWVHTEDNKRRTLQRNDIAMAITKYDQFDFLIDIVPREEVKQVKKEPETKSSVISDQVQYYLQLAQQHQQALQQGSVTTAGPSSTINQLVTPSIITATTSTGNGCLGGTPTIQVHGQTLSAGPSTLTLAPSQNYLVTNSVGQQATVIGNLQPQQQQQQQQQPIQLVQQIVSQNGEITHVPINISQNQLNLIRMQIQNQTSQPPIIIQTSPMQQPTQILHVAQNPTTGNVYLNTTPTQHNQSEE